MKLPPTIDLQARIATSLMEGLGVTGVAFYRVTGKRGVLALTHAEGLVVAPPAVRAEGGCLRLIHPEEPAVATPAANGAAPWEAQVPVRTNTTELGCIALGPKASGARIDEADLTLLNLVAAQLAIAMQNVDYVRQRLRPAAWRASVDVAI